MLANHGLTDLLRVQQGKMRQVSSQGRQVTSRCAAYRFHVADPIPFQRSIVVDIDHGYTNQVQTDYSSLAYWYQAEPHAPFPTLLPAAQRLPTPAARNAIQFALFTSPAWLPATMLGLKALRSLFGRKNREG